MVKNAIFIIIIQGLHNEKKNILKWHSITFKNANKRFSI